MLKSRRITSIGLGLEARNSAATSPSRPHDLVALLPQDHTEQAAQTLLVLHNHDRFGPSRELAKRRRDAGMPARAEVKGRYTLKVLPCPGLLFTSMNPK